MCFIIFVGFKPSSVMGLFKPGKFWHHLKPSVWSSGKLPRDHTFFLMTELLSVMERTDVGDEMDLLLSSEAM